MANIAADAAVPKVDDNRPRYGNKTRFEVIARYLLTEMVFYLGSDPVRAIERLAEAQASQDQQFAWVNIYVPGEPSKEKCLILECMEYRKEHPPRK